MVTTFIALGSNLGDRQGYIDKAIKKIKILYLTRLKRVSRIIESLPEGGPAQGPYLNCVVQLETELAPYQLLQELQKIEIALGRVRTIKNAPRTIDLDILTYADLCMHEDALCIPHPRLLERKFVLEPLKEIAPQEVKNLLRRFSKPQPQPKSKTSGKITASKIKRKSKPKHR